MTKRENGEGSVYERKDGRWVASVRDRAWAEWHIVYRNEKEPLPRPDDWRNSIEMFHKAGLPESMMVDAVAIAGRLKATTGATFRYFCGVCWRMLDELRAVAVEVIAEEAATDGS